MTDTGEKVPVLVDFFRAVWIILKFLWYFCVAVVTGKRPTPLD